MRRKRTQASFGPASVYSLWTWKSLIKPSIQGGEVKWKVKKRNDRMIAYGWSPFICDVSENLCEQYVDSFWFCFFSFVNLYGEWYLVRNCYGNSLFKVFNDYSVYFMLTMLEYSFIFFFLGIFLLAGSQYFFEYSLVFLFSLGFYQIFITNNRCYIR